MTSFCEEIMEAKGDAEWIRRPINVADRLGRPRRGADPVGPDLKLGFAHGTVPCSRPRWQEKGRSGAGFGPRGSTESPSRGPHILFRSHPPSPATPSAPGAVTQMASTSSQKGPAETTPGMVQMRGRGRPSVGGGHSNLPPSLDGSATYMNLGFRSKKGRMAFRVGARTHPPFRLQRTSGVRSEDGCPLIPIIKQRANPDVGRGSDTPSHALRGRGGPTQGQGASQAPFGFEHRKR